MLLALAGCGARSGLDVGALGGTTSPVCTEPKGTTTVLVPRGALSSFRELAVRGERVWFLASHRTRQQVIGWVSTSGGAPVERLTATRASHFAVHGSTLFFTVRDGATWTLRAAGGDVGEARVATLLVGDVRDLAVAPDGTVHWVSGTFGAAGQGVHVWSEATGVRTLASDVAPHVVAASENDVVAAGAAPEGGSDVLRMSRATGARASVRLAPGVVAAIAIDGARVFVASADSVQELGKERGTLAKKLPSPVAMVADDTSLWIASTGLYHDDLPPPKPANTPGDIRRIDKNGGEGAPVEVVSVEGRDVASIAVDACHVYWTSERGIVRYAK